MTGFLEVITEILFRVLPPAIWAIIVLVVYAIIAILTRMRASTGAFFGFLLILVFAESVGGVFNQLGAGLSVIATVVFFLGAWKIIGQR